MGIGTTWPSRNPDSTRLTNDGMQRKVEIQSRGGRGSEEEKEEREEQKNGNKLSQRKKSVNPFVVVTFSVIAECPDPFPNGLAANEVDEALSHPQL